MQSDLQLPLLERHPLASAGLPPLLRHQPHTGALVSAFNATKTRQEKARILDQMKRTIIEERRARLN
jgi:hypothetical protein